MHGNMLLCVLQIDITPSLMTLRPLTTAAEFATVTTKGRKGVSAMLAAVSKRGVFGNSDRAMVLELHAMVQKSRRLQARRTASPLEAW